MKDYIKLNTVKAMSIKEIKDSVKGQLAARGFKGDLNELTFYVTDVIEELNMIHVYICKDGIDVIDQIRLSESNFKTILKMANIQENHFTIINEEKEKNWDNETKARVENIRTWRQSEDKYV